MALPEAIAGAPDANSFAAIESVLARRGVSLDRAWSEFLLWKRRLGHFEEGAAYKDALATSDWPRNLRMSRPRSETCRLTSDSASGEGLQPLSGDYVLLRPATRARFRQRARVVFEGPTGTAASFILKPIGSPAQEGLLTFNPEGVASLGVPLGRRETRSLTVGLGNGSRDGDESQIGYAVEDRDPRRGYRSFRRRLDDLRHRPFLVGRSYLQECPGALCGRRSDREGGRLHRDRHLQRRDGRLRQVVDHRVPGCQRDVLRCCLGSLHVPDEIEILSRRRARQSHDRPRIREPQDP
jgi:hypothetical protein